MVEKYYCLMRSCACFRLHMTSALVYGLSHVVILVYFVDFIV
ncbi:hypothetical protein GV51_0998 [Gardnerella vaginalis 5-1]|nr:hypothetical protein GV51_0998 [Gardnerella vaginalis 5-1]